jgi:hypothetical protein
LRNQLHKEFRPRPPGVLGLYYILSVGIVKAVLQLTDLFILILLLLSALKLNSV